MYFLSWQRSKGQTRALGCVQSPLAGDCPSRPTWWSCHEPLLTTLPGWRAHLFSCIGSFARSLTWSGLASGLPVPALPHAHFVTLDAHHFFLGLFRSLQNGHDPCLLGSEEEVNGQVTLEAVRQKGKRREELGGLQQGPGGSPH